MTAPPLPGSSVTLAPQANYPGMHPAWTAEKPYFERAYAVEEEAGLVARVRFHPVAIPTGIEANIPLQTRNISILVSASLVDEDGQVELFNGRGLVRPARSFSQEVSPGVAFDAEDFILFAASVQVEDLVAFKQQIESAGLLIPPPLSEVEVPAAA